MRKNYWHRIYWQLKVRAITAGMKCAVQSAHTVAIHPLWSLPCNLVIRPDKTGLLRRIRASYDRFGLLAHAELATIYCPDNEPYEAPEHQGPADRADDCSDDHPAEPSQHVPHNPARALVSV